MMNALLDGLKTFIAVLLLLGPIVLMQFLAFAFFFWTDSEWKMRQGYRILEEDCQCQLERNEVNDSDAIDAYLISQI